MSWNFEFIAVDKEAAKAEVRKRQAESSGPYPAEVADFTCALIDRHGHMPGYEAIIVKTSGHLPSSEYQQTGTGNCRLEVSNSALVKATPPPPVEAVAEAVAA